MLLAYLLLHVFHPLIMLVRCTAEEEHNSISQREIQIVDQRERHQEQYDKDPSVVYNDILETSVLVIRIT